LHDLQTLDRRGIPGCGIASEEFKPAAAAQSRALGFMPAMVWLRHPIQSLTPDELAALADEAIDTILDNITA